MERNRLKILITGGAGFVGTNLIKTLQKVHSNSEIQVIDNYVTGFTKNHQDGVIYHNADITTDQAMALMASFQPDVIYHLAALARIQPSFKYPTPTFNANVVGTQRVLEYARINKTPVIYAGSSSTHGGVHKNPYTFSKWLGEELCIMYSKVYDIPTIITRFYNVYGEHMIPGDHAYSTVVQIFDEQRVKNSPLTITGDGEQRRDFTHVLDICDALTSCINHPELRAEFFELGRGENFSINEIAQMYNHPITYILARPGEAKTTLADFSKATEILGYSPSRNIKDWIQK
jgi:nucleoside-diphosphate-sugar epimerase